MHDQDLLLPATSRLPEPPPMPEPGTFLQIGISKGGSRKVAIIVERSRKKKSSKLEKRKQISVTATTTVTRVVARTATRKIRKKWTKMFSRNYLSQLPLLANLETSPLAASSGGSNY